MGNVYRWIFGALVGLTAIEGASFAQVLIRQPDQTPVSVTLSNSTPKTIKYAVGKTVTSTGGANIPIARYVATTGTTFYLQHVDFSALVQGVTVTTAQDLGFVSLQSPQGTVIARCHMTAYQGAAQKDCKFEPAEALPIASGVEVILVADVTTGANATSVEWNGNILGFER